MRWLIVCMCVCAVAGVELRCDPPDCLLRATDHDTWFQFYVEGGKVEVNYKESYFYLNCHRRAALDSLATPRFTSEFRASVVVLSDCPLPTTRNASLINAIEALNVTLEPVNGETHLRMVFIPSEPQLAPLHFIGLEHLTNLTITSLDLASETPVGVFAELRNLRFLELSGIPIPVGELHRLPHTLKALDLGTESLDLLPNTLPELISKTILALPDLLYLRFEKRGTSYLVETNNTNAIEPQKSASSSLETLSLNFWQERRLTALKQCQNLRIFEINKAIFLSSLPERFVAACPRLEELRMILLPTLKPLPAKFLEGATRLKHLSLQNCHISSLPEGIFQEAPNLIELDLSFNELMNLPSGIFLGLPLQSLSLRHNAMLNKTDLNELATLTTLTEINLASVGLHDVCDDNGYSPLQNMTQLKKLDLSHNHITRICRDWRENLVFLETLNVHSDEFKLLKFADFQYKRDASVKKSTVNVGGWINRVNFTEDDYKNASTAPETSVTLTFVNEFVYDNAYDMACDCRTYWLRRALDDASQAIKIEGLVCKNGRQFKNMTSEEMCPKTLRPYK